MVSYQSTSPTLSNKEKYEYFFRTVPSDVNQAKAIVEILKAFHWTYVSVVYSDTDYGNKGYEKLQELAPREICFSNPQSINVDHFTDTDYDTVIQNLMHKTNARVVVVFSDKQVAKNVMAAAARRRAFKRFVWIGSEAWGGRQYVVEGHEEVVEGAITISPLLRPLAGFDEHFKSLTPENNAKNNPWFPEFWEEHFYCKLQDFYVTPYNQKFHKWCQEMAEPKISEANGYRQMPALHFVRDAAYAFAHALSSVHKTLCGGAPGLCERLRTMDGRMLKEAMEKVHFKDESEKTFRFLPSGDAPPRYSIINFQKKSDSNEYVWRPVGTYALNEMGIPYLDLDKNALRFKHLEMEFPRSFCSAPCHLGQAKLQLEGDTCCWLCTNCSAYQYLPDQFRCEDCPLGTLPALPDKTRCDPIPEAYLSYSNPWAVGTMAFAGMGILTTVGVAVQFWKFRDTPVIKASGRELSGLLLLGIFLSFSMTFVIVAKPAPCTCGITRFFLGFCYTLCYAAIVTKTNRIARIFNQRRLKPCQKPRYTSPKSQLIITALLVSIEGIINTTWLLYDRPAVTHMYPTREENVLICLGSDTASYLVGLIYPFVLIGFCTVYAFKTRKCPDGFNEARYLTFTNYTTCVIWLAFLPLFVLSTSNTIRSVTLSSLLSLSGAVQLACLFMPKVYIAVFKPEKNTKDAVMCPHNRNSSCLALPAAGLYQAPPSNLLNGGCKDNYRNSTCSSASPASIRNSKFPGNKHNSDHNLCYSQESQHHTKNTCPGRQENLGAVPSAPSCNHQTYPNIDQHMTL
ncbi:metabotropic glutamate receptor 3 [Nephila pilipes]|uniref:Metabotropic glutamate receptor 3 n=1 Tax=Nephila pilipes TaxID=299642 RepID=A0A8X6UIR9_NEPPI|nr:metabotropic glutamate receptor 3 [Nephila pilipes]